MDNFKIEKFEVYKVNGKTFDNMRDAQIERARVELSEVVCESHFYSDQINGVIEFLLLNKKVFKRLLEEIIILENQK